MQTINIGLIGLGNIGRGVVQVVQHNRSLIREKSGLDLAVKAIADRSAARKRDLVGNDCALTDNPDDVLTRDDIHVIVEVVGGVEPARSYITAALQHGKHVVTANKAVVSEHYTELTRIARAHNVNIKFEASVGGCVPIVKSLKESLVADEVTSLYGILNGTSNFILTCMENGRTYAQALQEAQDRGFAEPDPSFDVSGKDAAQKLVILALLAFNVKASIANVYVEGIEQITLNDIGYARELGYCVKLLAIAKQSDGRVELRVHPVLIPRDHLIATVHNELNAVFVEGHFVGEQMYYGRGAGQLPTAAAVVGDVVDIFLHHEHEKELKTVQFVPIDDVQSHYYVRFAVAESVGVLATITRILADNHISILSVVQKETEKDTVPVVMLTHRVPERSLTAAIRAIDALDIVRSPSMVIRIEGKVGA